jgi:hypothetical protein
MTLYPLPWLVRTVDRYRKQYPVVTELLGAGVLLVAVIVLTAGFTGRVWIPASRDGVLIPALFEVASTLLNGEARVYWGCVGLLCGLFLVWVSDSIVQYRTMGPLVVLATVVVLFGHSPTVLQPSGGTAAALPTLLLLVWFSVTLLAGLSLGGVPLVGWLRDKEDLLDPGSPYHYELAPVTTVGILGLSVVLGLLDFHLLTGGLESLSVGLQNRGEILTNVVLGVTIVVLVLPFATYRNDTRIVQLGPARAGKSAMFAGTAVKLDQEDRLFTGDGERSEAIEEAMTRLQGGRQRRFPDRTARDETNFLRFSYVSSEPIFKTKTTLTAVDYGGELLTADTEEGRSLDEHVEERVGPTDESMGNESYATRALEWIQSRLNGLKIRDDWERAFRDISEEDGGPDDLRPKLAKLVVRADTIVFTLPMDDYLHHVVDKADENGSGLRSYTDLRVYEEAEGTGGDEQKVRRPGGESVEVEGYDEGVNEIRRDGEGGWEVAGDHDNAGDEFQTGFETISDLPQISRDPAIRYAVEQDRVRKPPEDYQAVYKGIVDTFRNRDKKRYTWVTTKTDLVLDEFENFVSASDEMNDLFEFENKSLAVQIQYGEGLSKPRGLQDGELRMKVFSWWVLRRNVLEVFPELTRDGGYLGRTYQDFVYPVWFRVESSKDGIVRPKSDVTREGDPLFLGWQYVLNRYRGNELVQRPGDSRFSELKRIVEGGG